MSVNMKENGALVPIASLTKAIIPIGVSDCYVMEEHQVGAWIDGKPLYQKIIDFGALPNNTSKEVPHGITGIDQLVDFRFFATNSARTAFIPINFAGANKQADLVYQVSANVTDTVIKVYTGNNRSAFGGYAILEYTKQSDTAGSGIFVPSGAYAEHYTTAEQVIGTWIDGSTLYRKTFQTTSPSALNTSTNIIDVSGLNIAIMTKLAGVIVMATNQTHEGGGSFILWYRSSSTSPSDSKKIACQVKNSSYTASTMYVTIEYTKSS